MDVKALESAVQGLFAEGLAGSTRSSYSTAQKRYLTFCSLFHLSPLHLSEHTLCLFAAFLANEGLQARTISAYLWGLRHFQITTLGRGCTHLRGHLRLTTLGRGCTMSPGVPLNQVVHPFNNVLYWAAACTAFFGLLRLGEVFPKSAGEAPPLQLQDLSTDSHTRPSIIKRLIRRSKTDPFGRGYFVVLGKSGHATCPVAALRDFLLLRPKIEGPLFVRKDSTLLSKEDFIRAVRPALA